MNDKYPQGKLNDHDESALEIGITKIDDKVIINFGKRVSWIGFDKDTALNIADAIRKHATSIE